MAKFKVKYYMGAVCIVGFICTILTSWELISFYVRPLAGGCFGYLFSKILMQNKENGNGA